MSEQTPATPPTPPAAVKPPPEPKWLFYILSFVISLFGIIFGIVYLVKDDEENKKFGKMCLILGLIPSVLGCLCWILMMVFGVGSSLFGGEVTTYTY